MTKTPIETGRKRRPLNVAWLIETAKQFTVEYAETHLLSISTHCADHGDIPEVQLRERGLLELSPMEKWNWVKRNCDEYPYEAYVMIGDVRFLAILESDPAALKDVSVEKLPLADTSLQEQQDLYALN